MLRRKLCDSTLWLFLGLTFLGLVSCKGKTDKEVTQLTGAGASLPQPYYQLVFKNFQDTFNISVNYGAVGSGGGIRSLRDCVLDFGASDAYLSDAEITEFEGGVVHIPTCMAAVVLAYNLPGVDTLNLDAQIISDVYLGKITKWNDSAIVALNPTVELPDLAITPVYRSDGSGTTNVFSHYLSSVNEEWKEKMGSGKALQWTTGVAGKGNPGVAGIISLTPGALGYIGSEYAFSLQIPSARLRNAAGAFVTPSVSTISAAGDQNIPDDTRAMITNAPAENAYPISCFTWIILYKDQAYTETRTMSEAKATLDLMYFILSDQAQTLTETVHYARLPESVRKKALAQLDLVTFDGEAIER